MGGQEEDQPVATQALQSFNPSAEAMGSREFKLFRTLIHQQTGIFLRDGKEVMLASRLSRRLRALHLESFSEYFSHVEKAHDGGKELGELINCITTNKTSFFRESHHFDFLRDTLVPEMERRAAKGGGKNIRIWSAACSTGEEPYSIVITLLEALRKGGSEPVPGNWTVKVTASDIDTTVLQTARTAVYEDKSLEAIDASLVGKYFLRGTGGMSGQIKVKPEVTRNVEFQRINLMDRSWPLEGLYDTIFFRNALIYFNQDTQNIFLRKMLQFLRPQGYLILGHSENVPWLHDAVHPLKMTIYQLRDNA